MSDVAENHAPSPVCFVSFASMGEGVDGGCHFEWANALMGLGVAHVLMRDARMHWYQQGVDGIGDIDAVAAYVRSLKDRYDRVISIGVSMGGFGALLFGILADVEVVAINPQTVVDIGCDLRPQDRRWADSWPKEAPQGDIAALPPGEARVRIFVGAGDHAHRDDDIWHARRCAWVRMSLVPDQDHVSTGKYLRDNGYFQHLISNPAL